MRIAVVNLKGGTGKTTTAMSLAAALSERGRTLLVDADPQASALSWSEAAGDLPLQVVSLPVRDLHLRLVELGKGYEHLVLDTPPGQEAIVRSALRAVSLVLVPIPPALMDLDRLRPTLEMIAEAESANPNLTVRIVLTKVRAGTRSARAARELLVEIGMPILDTEIPLRESIASIFGAMPRSAEYLGMLDELCRLEVA